MVFYFENTEKATIFTEEDKEYFENNNVCPFCENENISGKVRDHCHLTGAYRGPTHQSCNVIVIQEQSKFFPSVFHNFSNCGCHLFFLKVS